MRLVVVSTAKGAAKEAGPCIESVRVAIRQAHTGAHLGTEFRHRYAAADDATLDVALGAAHNRLSIVGGHHRTALGNVQVLTKGLDPEDVVVWLDGDDQLTPHALRVVLAAYQRPDVWLTYGSFVTDTGIPDYQWHAPFGRRYTPGGHRREAWRASHLRTFRAGLFQRIPPEYLDTEWSTDRAVMFPLLDMAGENYACITDTLAIYNTRHAAFTQDPRTAAEEGPANVRIARMAPLARLEERPW